MSLCGQSNYGKVDRTYAGERELFYVATRFLHLYGIPLLPLGSFAVMSGTESLGGFRGVRIPICGRSVLVAYLRTAGWLAWGMVALSAGMGSPVLLLLGLLALGAGMAGRLLGRPAPGRTEELARRLGLIADGAPGCLRAQAFCTPVACPTFQFPQTLAFAQGPPISPPPPSPPLARTVIIRDPASKGGGRGFLGIMAVALLLLCGGFLFSPWGKALLNRNEGSTPGGPSDGQRAYQEALVSYQAARWSEAATSAEVALNLLTGEGASSEERIKARRILGSSLYKMKSYEKAYEQYRTLLTEDPTGEEDRKTADAIHALMVKQLDHEARQLLSEARSCQSRGSINRAERLAGDALVRFQKSGNTSGAGQARRLVEACQNVGTDPASAEKRRKAMEERQYYYYYDY